MKHWAKSLLAALTLLCVFITAQAAEIPNTSVFSQTDANNNTGTVPSWAEGMAPSAVNDSARALQGALTREWNWSHPTITSGGSANAQTLTYSVAPAAYYNGQRFCFEAGFATTSSSTLNVNSLGAVAIKYLSSGSLTDTAANTIRAGDRPCVTYRMTGPSFVLENALAGGTAAGMTNPMTTQGDVIYGGASGTPTRLAVGTSNQVLRSDGTNPDWESINTLVAGEHTIWIPASAMTSRTTNGCAAGSSETTTNDIMVITKDCDQTTSEGVQATIAMPKSWNESTVTFIPYWTASAGSAAQTVIWSMRAIALSNDDALDTAFGTGQTSSDALIATGDVHVGPESSAITIGGTPAEGDWVVFEVSRDVSDTLAADAKLLGVKIIYTVNAATDD